MRRTIDEILAAELAGYEHLDPHEPKGIAHTGVLQYLYAAQEYHRQAGQSGAAQVFAQKINAEFLTNEGK